jgi:UDP-GlcNAc3NAcA epimerase
MFPHLLDKKILEEFTINPYFRIIDPVPYFDMLMLESRCRMMVTDSGGVQKESYFFRKPCLVLRPESEWVEIVDQGTAILVDTDPGLIQRAFEKFTHHPPQDFPPVFGDGRAAEFILNKIADFLNISLQE